MPDNSDTPLKVTATAVQAVQEAVLERPVSPIEAYCCNLHVLDAVQDSQQVACMTIEDWHQAQEAHPVLSLVIARLWDGMLGKCQSKATDPPMSVSTGRSVTIYCSNRVSNTDGPGPENLRRPSFSWFCQLCRGRLLLEYAMMWLAIWAWSTCSILCMTGSSGFAWLHRQKRTLESATHALPLKPGSPKPPWEHHGHTSCRAGPP